MKQIQDMYPIHRIIMKIKIKSCTSLSLKKENMFRSCYFRMQLFQREGENLFSLIHEICRNDFIHFQLVQKDPISISVRWEPIWSDFDTIRALQESIGKSVVCQQHRTIRILCDYVVRYWHTPRYSAMRSYRLTICELKQSSWLIPRYPVISIIIRYILLHPRYVYQCPRTV